MREKHDVDSIRREQMREDQVSERKVSVRPKSPRELGLYIHIPFCVKKCDYCDFLSAPATDKTIESYFKALQIEIDSYYGVTGDYIIPTIFIGGGTPSAVDAKHIVQIMNALDRVFSINHHVLEASIEINPGTVTKDMLKAYKDAGINRLSIGLQSADNRELKLLGRIHSYEEFEETYSLAREIGFHNINIDLMSALPGQTLTSWENTLNRVIALEPEHISAYSLIIEEGTKFYDRYHNAADKDRFLPDEETDRIIYHRTKEILEEKGYVRYEISNYAKKGYECRHNSSYWIGTEYLGIGLGASSLLNGARFSNLHDIKQYIYQCTEYDKGVKNKLSDLGKYQEALSRSGLNEDPLCIRMEYEVLAREQRMEEFMFLGLRICAGISKEEFNARFGIRIESIYGKVLEELCEKGLIEMKDDNIRLTDYGIDISNYVLSEFLIQ